MQDQIVHYLRKAQGYLSGEEISGQLNISRSAIWKYIQELRREGYDIIAVPHLGYRLAASPDKLLPQEVQYDLGTRVLGKRVIFYETIGSTMDAAFRLGIEGAPEGTVICADGQTQGKGRLGRTWSSPKGKGIYISVILRPPLPPADVAQLTLMSAVAVCEAVKEMTGIAAKIKWPNDLLAGDRKFAGILTELSAEMDRVRFVVAGIGINVSAPLSALPAHATSLKNETKMKISRVELAQEILRRLEHWYDILKTEGFSSVLDQWKILSSTLGRHVRVVDQSGDVEGVAVDLDEYGSLLIRKDSGVTVRRSTGDVIQAR